MVDYNSRDSPYRSDEKHGDEYSHSITNILKSLKVEIRSYKEDNDKIIQSQERLSTTLEKKEDVNAIILKSLSYLQR